MNGTAPDRPTTDPAARHLRAITAVDAAQLRRAQGMWLLPPLLWIGQSAVVATVLSALLQGTPALPWLIAMAGLFLLIGLTRVGLETRAADRLAHLARAMVRRLRDALIAREARP